MQIENNNQTEPGDDFMAGFTEGDEDTSGKPQPKPEGGEGGEGGEGTGAPAGGGEGGTGTGTEGGNQGVDDRNNREQGQPQSSFNRDDLPDEVRQQLEELDRLKESDTKLRGTLEQQRRDYQALHGRLAPLQRQLEQATKQPPAQPAAASGQDAKDKGEAPLTEAAKDLADAHAYYESEAFKSYERTFPEEAKVMRDSQLKILERMAAQEKRFEEQGRRFDQMLTGEVKPQLDQLREDRQQSALERSKAALQAEHPDWEQLNASDAFWDWFEAERPYLNFSDEQHMRARLTDNQFVSHLLTRYKREKSPAAGAGDGTGTVVDPPLVPAAKRDGGNNARLALSGRPEGRDAPPTQRGGRGGVTEGDDFMAGFNSD